MERGWLIAFLALASTSAFAQSTAPTTCQFVGPGILRCNSAQGLPPVPQTLPSNPSPVILPSNPDTLPTNGAESRFSVQLLPIPPSLEQREPPKSVDIKSAYCIGEISVSAAQFNALLQSRPKMASDGQKEQEYLDASARQLVQQEYAKVRRLQSYLSPRLARIDNGMLMAALKQGQADASNVGRETDTCLSRCGAITDSTARLQCANTCTENSQTYQHTKMCQKIAFLPY